MPDLLAIIEERLRSCAARAGFALADTDTSGIDGDLALLEYRRASPGQPLVLLDIGIAPAATEITAYLWSPGDLASFPGRHSAEDMAIRSRRWSAHAPADPAALADEVADEVGEWIEQTSAGAGME